MSKTAPPPANDSLDTLGRFAAAFAHEVNNPLGAVVMNAEVAALLLERGRLDELPAVLRQIQNDARRCAAKIRAMADVADPALAGSAPLVLAEAIEAVRRRLCRRLDKPIDAVRVEIPLRLPNVHGNRAALEYSLYQLARQVLAHGGELRIAAEPAGDAVRISISAAAPVERPARAHALGSGDAAALELTRSLLAGSRAKLELDPSAPSGSPGYCVTLAT